ncbi:Splicing factor 3B subunit 10 (SF3b10) [Musa troglodytarum]|uniref:Splicing factor 3B subunit 10 (SF3b10) n=1 Tax=Musa troglodytarum TaxID=320322 RepID=A0A9E7K076_9LILI|nr:Splicing factor 3B subunit 10 (SF3b10) [Musa troglodytarum]
MACANLPLRRPARTERKMDLKASDRFNINSQLEHLQAKYVGTGHADLSRFEWAVNIQRDSYASFIGHYPILAYFAVAENESIGREQNVVALWSSTREGRRLKWIIAAYSNRLLWPTVGSFCEGVEKQSGVKRRPNSTLFSD